MRMKCWKTAISVLIAAFLSANCSPGTNPPGPKPAEDQGKGSVPKNNVPPWPSGFPKEMPPAVISGNVPFAVFLPANFSTPLEIRPYFDNFSWESFIALNWPVSATRGVPDQPGDPDRFLKAPAGTPVVWGSYKDSFDLFGQKDQRPGPWDAADGPVSPCSNAQAGVKTLYFVSKGNTSLMDTKQAFSFPLVDQRGKYVYYDIRYDKAQYNFVRGDDNDPASWLYLLKNLVPKENAQFGVQMPMTTTMPQKALGSIMVKASWRIKTDKDDASRFYSVNAQIYDAQSKMCTPATVLLVGLHIAHKIDPFTEWVWSTFEQVDNVRPDTPPASPPPNGYSFNNGTDNPKTTGGYDYKPGVNLVSNPMPVQVTRVNAIPTTPPGQSTQQVNAYYQSFMGNSVWRYYQLVVTQWPFNPGIGKDGPFMLMQNGGVYPQNAGSAFPVDGAVNTTMETYFQTQNDAAGAGGNSCMSCHYRAGQSDFSWGLNRRAH
jgi:hypothetical protein